jgi:hypothetical protein
MKHHPLDVSSSDGLTSYSHQPQVVAEKIIYHASGWKNNVMMKGVLTCHLLSILSQGGYWYLSADRWGKTMPNHHWPDCPVNHGPCQPWSNCANHTTLVRPLAVLDSNPGHGNQCPVSQKPQECAYPPFWMSWITWEALSFEGDAVHDGAGDSCESLTSTCVIFFPCQVCVVVTSNMSALDPESLIFGILCMTKGWNNVSYRMKPVNIFK